MSETAARRIGILGGSFDPPHLAHLALARCARDHLGLAELRWLPAATPWQKAGQAMSEGAHRAAMIAALMAGEPGMVLDERELRRGGLTYTIDTVLEMHREWPDAELVWILGEDQYRRFATWHRWRELLPLLHLAVAAREGQAPRPEGELATLPHRASRLPMPRLDIAATDIRARAARGESIESLVGPAVAGYIGRHGLYRLEATRD